MNELLTQLEATGFKQILIISSVVNYRRRLAMSLLKLLPRPSLSALDPEVQGLPDEGYDWSEVDLVLIDLSESRQSIKHWYVEQSDVAALPPVIFLDNKATVDDAGDLIRGGGADYIDVTRLNTRRLSRALLIAADDRYRRSAASSTPPTPEQTEPTTEQQISRGLEQETMVMQSVPSISGMNDEPTEMLPVMTSDVLDTMEHEQVENERASFLTTGLMNILDREKLKAQYEVEAKVPEVTGRNEFLTTGLISILERGKSTELELPKNHSVQTEDIPIGDGWPFTREQIEQGEAGIDQYRILQFIEVGGTASVFKAQDRNDDHVCAIKLLDDSHGISNNRERFLRGYQLIQSVKHPNIVSIKDLVSSGELTYVVMEYFPGGDLKQQIERGIERTRVVRYAAQIAAALNAAHEHEILHRDLKPSNVLIREDGTLALLDFGIAKLMAEDKSDLTQAGFVVGTSHYISPEQALGKQLDARSDLYALGVMLYEMLEGHRPYTGDSTIEIMQQHVRGPVPQLSARDDPLNPLVGKLMAKEPEERFNSGAEVIQALADAIPELIDHDFLRNL